MEWLFFFLCSYDTILCFSTSQPRVTLQRLHTRSNLSIRHLLGLDIRSQKVCKGIPISSAIPLQPQIWNSVAASLMLSLISDISVFKLFTPQYYFLRHIYTVYKAIGTKADNYTGCRHYASICLYTLLYGILPLIRVFTLPMFQVGKLGQKSGCLGQYQLS